jgi:hypothetical protein
MCSISWIIQIIRYYFRYFTKFFVWISCTIVEIILMYCYNKALLQSNTKAFFLFNIVHIAIFFINIVQVVQI